MLRLIGAGLPRTGTHSLKLALAQLTGAPCYHMSTLFEHLEDTATWQRAVEGEPVDWLGLFADYGAAVDWPTSAFWRDLAEAFPDAVILLSVRADGESWWRSVDATIMDGYRDQGMPPEWRRMAIDLWHRVVGPSWDDPRANVAGYDAWVDDVRRTAPPDRFVEWSACDGWAPICAALGVDVPDEPFPHVNTTAEWEQHRRQRAAEEAESRASAPESPGR